MGWQVGASQNSLGVGGARGGAPTESHWHAPALVLVEEALLAALGISSSFHRARFWLDEEVSGQAHQRWCALLRDGAVF